jgi:DUF1680 family protein
MNLPVLVRSLGLLALPLSAALAADYPVQPVPFTSVRLTQGFWADRQEVNRTVTVPFALKQCEDSGRLRNFDLAADTMRRRAAGEKGFQHQPPTQYPFDDSDAYKVIEGASYVLSATPDPALAAALAGWVTRIAAAQEPDGYLYDPKLSHELYDAGHLDEAAVAYYQATGRRTLLEVALRNAELLWRDFGEGRRRLAPGHEIVELGLVKLYRVTGDERWLSLAKEFLDARGPGGSAYNQQQALVVDQDRAVGHAVRANYLYSGMADVAALTGDQRYASAITRIWDNVVDKKLYLTGGVGALARGEAYGADYELPNDAYNETCAAVALMMWNERMFLLSGDSRYMDVFERTAYNGFISGVSESGDRFFYPNPLVYDGAAKNNSGFAGRAPWFGCACCPPNLMRMLASLSGYFYATRGDTLFVNLYAASEARVAIAGTQVKLTQATGYPWQGSVRLAVEPARSAAFTLRVRIPGWARSRPVPSDLYAYADGAAPAWSLRVNGAAVAARPEQGYVAIARTWQPGDLVELDLPLPVHTVRANAQVAATRGRVAFERGPLVYCVEDLDRRWSPDGLVVPASARVTAEDRPGLLGGVTALTIEGAEKEGRPVGPVTAIPYFSWDNRGLAPMAVWLKAGAAPAVADAR